MSEQHSIWSEEFRVRSAETDLCERWKPAAMFAAMQEAATNHAAHLGFGYREMLADEHLWILSRVKIRFNTFACLGDPVSLRTWPKGIQQKLFFTRDFQFFNQGECIAAATSAWLLINPSARRILPAQSFNGHLPLNEGLSAMDEPLEKIAAPENLPERFQVQAGYSAVDLIGHVNNARYIEWVCDCFDPEVYRHNQPDWLQINYSAEVLPGERIRLAAGPAQDDPQLWYVTGTHLSNGTRAFEALWHWRNPVTE